MPTAELPAAGRALRDRSAEACLLVRRAVVAVVNGAVGRVAEAVQGDVFFADEDGVAQAVGDARELLIAAFVDEGAVGAVRNGAWRRAHADKIIDDAGRIAGARRVIR